MDWGVKEMEMLIVGATAMMVTILDKELLDNVDGEIMVDVE